MKKNNLILSAAVAGLFAVSAYAGKDAKKMEMKEVPGATVDTCKSEGDTWDAKTSKCMHSGCASEGKAGCGAAKSATPAAAPKK